MPSYSQPFKQVLNGCAPSTGDLEMSKMSLDQPCAEMDSKPNGEAGRVHRCVDRASGGGSLPFPPQAALFDHSNRMQTSSVGLATYLHPSLRHRGRIKGHRPY